MAVAFRRSVTKSETSSSDMLFDAGVLPLAGSALILAVACRKTIGVTKITPFPGSVKNWELLYENDGLVEADAQSLEVVRVQIWAVLNVDALVASATPRFLVSFSGGTTPSERGVVYAEYTGDIFRFPNPADRVAVGVGTTAPFTTGDMEIGGVSNSREANELWVGVAAASPTVTMDDPDAPFVMRVADVPIGASLATLSLLDAFPTSIQSFRMRLEHDDVHASTINWAAAAAAMRGALQIPATPVETPSVGEPITENEDHEGDAIGHLLEQFKSHDKR